MVIREINSPKPDSQFNRRHHLRYLFAVCSLQIFIALTRINAHSMPIVISSTSGINLFVHRFLLSADAMTPLFDSNLVHVAWITRNRIFDRHLNWIAQITSRCVFSAAHHNYIGEASFHGVHDREGKVVLWNGKEPPRKLLVNRQPVTCPPMGHAHIFQLPDPPKTPDRTMLDDFKGWSELSFDQWFRGEVPHQDWIDLATL